MLIRSLAVRHGPDRLERICRSRVIGDRAWPSITMATVEREWRDFAPLDRRRAAACVAASVQATAAFTTDDWSPRWVSGLIPAMFRQLPTSITNANKECYPS